AAVQPMFGPSSGSVSTQVIDQLQRSPNVPPVCLFSEPITVSPHAMTRLLLFGSQSARGYGSAALRRRSGMTRYGPETWVTTRTYEMGDTLGPTGWRGVVRVSAPSRWNPNDKQ